MKTISELRDAGFKVRVKHLRAFKGQKDLLTRREYEQTQTGVSYQDAVTTHGGATVIELSTPDGKDIREEATCSVKDSFSRKKGLTIALGRALKRVAAHTEELISVGG